MSNFPVRRVVRYVTSVFGKSVAFNILSMFSENKLLKHFVLILSVYLESNGDEIRQVQDRHVFIVSNQPTSRYITSFKTFSDLDVKFKSGVDVSHAIIPPPEDHCVLE